jgi:hypothetical protein
MPLKEEKKNKKEKHLGESKYKCYCFGFNRVRMGGGGDGNNESFCAGRVFEMKDDDDPEHVRGGAMHRLE